MKNDIKNLALNFLNFFRSARGKSILLFLIIAVGIFLRTYHFHDWLVFSSDQVRDAELVRNVSEKNSPWPLMGPAMARSSGSKEQLFHLGPIYYYFQIASAKIFGNSPDKLAYPDLFFSILAIPLFYIFLKKYFSVNLSLGLTGLYAISFFAIRYSRFAWNPNSIPLFTILFLLSLYEFLANKERVRWIWAILLGVAIGIGIQLHAIVFVLFPTVAFSIFLYLIRKDWRIWSKLLVVFLIVMILNLGQIISEIKNNYANSEVFLNSMGGSVPTKENGLFVKLENDIDCHVEANMYMISSLDKEPPLDKNSCNFWFTQALKHVKGVNFSKNYLFWSGMLLSLLFSILGYLFLVIFFLREEEKKKKYFLALIILYVSISFVAMFPAIAKNLTEFRYFSPTFFVPFVFLGFLSDLLIKKFFRKSFIFIIPAFLFFTVTNLISIQAVVKDLSLKRASNSHFLILGEIESMVKYIINNSENQKSAYVLNAGVYASKIDYLAQEQDFNILNAQNIEGVPPGKPAFLIVQNSLSQSDFQKFKQYQKFGRVSIYKLEN